jgi:hypothetical protein
MYARDASFGEDLAQNGILWQEDLFAPADEDSRYTTDVEAYLGAQHEWMAGHLPKRGAIVEVNQYGQPKLPPKADRVYGKPGKSDHTAIVSRSRWQGAVRLLPCADAETNRRGHVRRRRRGGEGAPRRDAAGLGDDRRPPHRRVA